MFFASSASFVEVRLGLRRLSNRDLKERQHPISQRVVRVELVAAASAEAVSSFLRAAQ